MLKSFAQRMGLSAETVQWAEEFGRIIEQKMADADPESVRKAAVRAVEIAQDRGAAPGAISDTD
jgi:hypothetical protein